jgi:NhaA family Na+:H+ antiporter
VADNPRSTGRFATVRRFLTDEATGGYVLMAAAALALILANSPVSAAYFAAFATPVAGHSLLHWINDGLMALFFLLIGLELKRELVTGELSTWGSRLLPGAAALAGMAVPALIYLAVNHDAPANHRGWAIPAATDIAFALGVLALLGSRVPASLKLLVTAIAIIDDLGAIAVIAIAYTDRLDLVMLGAAAAGLAVLALLNRLRIHALWPYLLIGVGVWYAVLQSGVHATLAGVAVAMTIPLQGRGTASPLLRLEHRLSPLIALLVVPLFGFANAGIDVRGLNLTALIAPLPLGIALGLLLGKQIGVFGTIYALVRTGITPRPEGASWLQLWGVALLCGIGFTMSLFIAGLAFGDGSTRNEAAKLGILGGSLVAALCGYGVLAIRRRGDHA